MLIKQIFTEQNSRLVLALGFFSDGESQLHLSSLAASSNVKHTASPLNRAAISIYFEIWSFTSLRNVCGSVCVWVRVWVRLESSLEIVNKAKWKACDHLPTHLGRGELHTRRRPPKHTTLAGPSRRYPGKQEKMRASPTPNCSPLRVLKGGTPGSSHGSRSYSKRNRRLSTETAGMSSMYSNMEVRFVYLRK